MRKQAESIAEHPGAGYDFGIENIFDEKSYQRKAADQISQLQEHVIDKTIDEGLVSKKDKNQIISELHKRLDPKGYDNYAKSLAELNGKSKEWVDQKGLFGKSEDKTNLLNTQKAPFELLYNQSLRRMGEDRKAVGMTTGNKDMILSGDSLLAQVRPDEEIYNQNPVLVKAKVAADIAKEIGTRSGQLEGTSTEGITGFIEKIGSIGTSGMFKRSELINTEAWQNAWANPATKDAAIDLLIHPDLISESSYLGSGVQNFSKPFDDLIKSVGDLSGLRHRLDRTTDEIKTELFPEETPGVKDIAHKVRNVVNTSAVLAGYAALGSLGAEAAKALPMGEEAVIGGEFKPVAITESGQRLAHSFSSFGLGSFDANMNDADKFLDNDAAKAIYSSIGSVINTVGGELIELPILSKMPELQKPILEMANRIGEGTITKDLMNELLGKSRDAYIKYAGDFGINVGKNVAVMKYFGVANALNKMAFGGATPEDAMNEATSGLIDTALGVSLLSAFGAYGDLVKGKNNTVRSTIYNLANNQDAARDVIEQNYREGKYTLSEYNQKIQILNTAIAAKNNVNYIQQDKGVSFTLPQKTVYVSNLTAEGVLKNKLESPLLTDTEKSKLELQLNKLQTQREDIANGLTFDSDLNPLTEIFEAEKEYRTELQNYSTGVTDSDAKLKQSKQRYEKAILSEGKTEESTQVEKTKNAKGKKTSSINPEDLTTEDLQPTIVIEGREYTGKNHGEAMDKAILAGEIIPDKDTPEGKKWRLENGMFKDREGNVLTRDESGQKYGITASEQLADNRPKEIKPIEDKDIVPALEEIKLKVPDADLAATQDVVTRMNNAEQINEKDIEKAQQGLMDALDAHPEAEHLIAPLFDKLDRYELTTKTRTSTATEEVPTGRTAKTKVKISPILEQSVGLSAEIERADGTKVAGNLRVENGEYVIANQGRQSENIGEVNAVNTNLKLPSVERVENPIALDENGNVMSVTVETPSGDLITINDPEKALDIAIQLNAEIFGDIEEGAFREVYDEVKKEVTEEVPKFSEAEINKKMKAESDAKSKAKAEKDMAKAEEDYRNEVHEESKKLGELKLPLIPDDVLLDAENPRQSRRDQVEIKKKLAVLNKLIECF